MVGLLSASDQLPEAKRKMLDEWMASGCRLAWLIDPQTQTTHIFRANGEIQIVKGFDRVLSGEDVLVGFELRVGELG